MRELIERLGSVECGSRELDRDLAILCEPKLWLRARRPDTVERNGRQVVVPRYTTSLDAALALAERVLPGWTWVISPTYAEIAPGPWHYAENASDNGGQSCGGKTAPLALCIAILRALRTTEQHSPAQQKKED